MYSCILHGAEAPVNLGEGTASLLQLDVRKQSLRRVYVCRSDGNSGADIPASAQAHAALRFRDC